MCTGEAAVPPSFLLEHADHFQPICQETGHVKSKKPPAYCCGQQVEERQQQNQRTIIQELLEKTLKII